jgi:hypothetical protein
MPTVVSEIPAISQNKSDKADGILKNGEWDEMGNPLCKFQALCHEPWMRINVFLLTVFL